MGPDDSNMHNNEVGATKPKVVILKGKSNYPVWSTQTRTALRGKGLWKYVESMIVGGPRDDIDGVGGPRDGTGVGGPRDSSGGKSKTASKKKSLEGDVDSTDTPSDSVSEETHWEKTSQALSVIQTSIHEDIFFVIENVDTAYEAWTALRKRYYRTDTQSRVSNESAMHAIEHRDDVDVDVTIKQYKQLLTKARQSGDDISDEKAAHVLLGLVQKAESWQQYVGTLTCLMDAGNIGNHDNDFDFVESSLTTEQIRRVAAGTFKGASVKNNAAAANAGIAAPNPTTVLLTTMVQTMQALAVANNNSSGRRRNFGKSTGQFTGTCFHCGNRGHRKADCRKLKAELSANGGEAAANIATGAGGNDGGPSLSAAMAAFLASQSNNNID